MAPSCRSGVRGAAPSSPVTPESLEQQLQGDIPIVAHMPQTAAPPSAAVMAAESSRYSPRSGPGSSNDFRRRLPFGSAERPADMR
ncbi:hypothetical protein [Streptomyces sp. NPDC005969]|uniref:hypothetical protein n=1 Tax=Streptomyces sp. NPDC005969 TaxID=3156722 RepID=UPI0034050C8D